MRKNHRKHFLVDVKESNEGAIIIGLLLLFLIFLGGYLAWRIWG